MGRRPKGTVGELRSETKALKAAKKAEALKAPLEAEAPAEDKALAAPPTAAVTCESCVYFFNPYCTKNPPVVHVISEVADFNSPRPLYKDKAISLYPTCIIEMPCGEHKKK